MKRITHRGFADEYPENTLSAARQVATQADMIELDLRRCRSGEIAVIHDSFVDAVTETRGSVEDLSATALSRLNVCNSGQGVPTLRRVLDVVPPKIGLTLELKEAGIAADVIKTLRGINNGVVIASNDVGILHETRTADPTTPVALVFATDPQQHLSVARELGCSHIQPYWSICIATDLVEQAHKAGIIVYAWTIDT